MPKYAMQIAYDGSSYGGWQIQPNAVSIQSLIEQALKIILREGVSVTGSGRTDAGVHAIGQVAHFIATSSIVPRTLQHGLNGILPKDIRILDIYPVADDFHARYSALGKTYHYRLHLHPVLNPFTRLYSWHIPYKIDVPLLLNTLPLFTGTKDFTAFANESHKGAAAKSGVRTLHRLEFVSDASGDRLEFEGNGFLYKMVRNITGTLIDVAAGRISQEEIPLAFASKDRKLAGAAAPALGLFLMQVHYDTKNSSKDKNLSTPFASKTTANES